MNKLKYKDDYIEIIFITIETENPQKAFRVVLEKKRANEILIPSKLKIYLENSHPEVQYKPR